MTTPRSIWIFFVVIYLRTGIFGVLNYFITILFIHLVGFPLEFFKTILVRTFHTVWSIMPTRLPDCHWSVVSPSVLIPVSCAVVETQKHPCAWLYSNPGPLALQHSSLAPFKILELYCIFNSTNVFFHSFTNVLHCFMHVIVAFQLSFFLQEFLYY